MKNVILICAIALSGCNLTPTKTPAAAKAVTDKICNMSVEGRQLVRKKVDAATFPNKIRVECAGNVQG